ncbi:C40 family peptidase [Chromobacterium alticapitis]|uniref:Peptidoglycan endopeptidase n=1 Tax=Chromobacterium alticapitis TaxID=2073169 RepID=A0A2S5DK35_9NEIS|nr:C40 family peptidase [Chromobacterium alticapitis]POZ63407.1 peptidoglycan endopeptidase [Chromobacterium alticapitis]
MKLQLRLSALALAGFMVFAQAAPDKAMPDKAPAEGKAAADSASDKPEDPISKYAAPQEDAVGDLLLQAMSLLGVAYRFGGNTPDDGLDCSGFIRYVFQKSLRVNLPRTAAEMARIGKAVGRGELMPGDLVFFNTRGFSYSHVGIYMGNNKFIHAPRTGKNIEVSNLSQSYWTGRYNGARRVNRSTAYLPADTSADVSVKGGGKKSEPAAKCRKGQKKCKAAAEPARGKKAAKASRAAKSGVKKKHRH